MPVWYRTCRWSPCWCFIITFGRRTEILWFNNSSKQHNLINVRKEGNHGQPRQQQSRPHGPMSQAHLAVCVGTGTESALAIFASRPTHLGTLVIGKFRRIWRFLFRRPHQGINQELRLKINWCGEPLSSATCKTPTSTKSCVKSLTVNRRGRVGSRPVEATPTGRPSRSNEQYLLYCSSTLRFSVLFLSCKANVWV
jgi:hypothetical protein